MAKLTKAEREAVRLKFGGLCAYCGRELPDRWHADHIEPVVRYPEGGFYGGPMKMLHPERDGAHNFNPACPPCNIDKHAMTPERWREWLNVRREALKKTPGWRLLEAFGLVADTGAAVTFHFERAAQGAGERLATATAYGSEPAKPNGPNQTNLPGLKEEERE